MTYVLIIIMLFKYFGGIYFHLSKLKHLLVVLLNLEYIVILLYMIMPIYLINYWLELHFLIIFWCFRYVSGLKGYLLWFL